MVNETQPLTPPYPWFGSKRRVVREIWSRIGNVGNYIEPFFGSGAVLLGRPHPPGLETVGDSCGFIANFWRAVEWDPEAVAYHADWPVSEPDLHARHLWLVNAGKRRLELLQTDPFFYDPLVAGWWLYGVCLWIGTGWCVGNGSHGLEPGAMGVAHQIPQLVGGQGVHRQLPQVGRSGRGVHRKLPTLKGPSGVHRKIPHLAGTGRGMHRPSMSGRDEAADEPEEAELGASREAIREMLLALSERLRSHRLRPVRVCCGDWSRITGDSVIYGHKVNGVFLDPPYAQGERHFEVYASDTEPDADPELSTSVRNWAVERGEDPRLRIALCGYVGEHELPASWECFRWKTSGGYGGQGQGRGRENRRRECIWFSPHCLKPTLGLFGAEDEDDMSPEVPV